MKDRYNRNIGTISHEENERLKQLRVCVIGCGGLGGHVIEELGRLGIGHITGVDGDVFEPTNLNRQILSTEKNLGKQKADAAKERMAAVNSEVEVNPICTLLDESNSREIVKGHDVVIDALDNIRSRKVLEHACEAEKLPLVHGAIAGWHGQVAVIMPGDRLFEKLYPHDVDKGAEVETGNPSFTPAVVAAMEVAEAVKLLLGKPGVLKDKLLTVDLLNQEYETIEL